MATTLNFKPGLDLPQWRPLAPPPNSYISTNQNLASDLRNDSSRVPLVFVVSSTVNMIIYNPLSDGWMFGANPTLSAFGAGATSIIHPSQGPRGTLAAGNTTSTIILSTALPAIVGTNQLANKGDGIGFRIRIIGNSSGGSGKIEERFIIGNTIGTTPTITLDIPLSFTPASGDTYEMLSGRLYMLGNGTAAAGVWKYFDIATQAISASLGFTNLPGTIGTDSVLLALSECHISNDRMPSTGFVSGSGTYDQNGIVKNCIAATAVTTTSITGSGMPTNLYANEYTNFQVRIVYDPTNTTSLGQRRIISSHTAGATSVFTISTAWTVTPSTSALFVVENNDDLILLRSSGTSLVYTYHISTNLWDLTTFTQAVNSSVAGMVFAQCFGITRDPTGNRRQSHIFFYRGSQNGLDILDIANGTTGTWASTAIYGFTPTTIIGGASAAISGVLDPVTLGGKYLYIRGGGTNWGQSTFRFNMLTTTFEPYTYLRWPDGNGVVGNNLAMYYYFDNTATPIVKIGFLMRNAVTTSNVWAFFQLLLST